MSWAAVAIGAASIGLSAYEYSSAPGAPQSPNLAASNAAGVQAQAGVLPYELGLESAAQQGTNFQAPGLSSQTVTRAQLAQAYYDNRAKLKASNNKDPALTANQQVLQTMLNQLKPGQTTTLYHDGSGNVIPPQLAQANFTGFGQAQVQGAVAQKNAASQLALEQKYGPQFVQAALDQEKLADPQGVAARAAENDLIQKEITATPDRPVATLLDQQVGQQLAAGKNLDSISQNVLNDAVASSQADRGGSSASPAADFSQPLTTGFAGQARLQAGENAAQSWLASGTTPADVAYRRQQQNLSDLSSLVNGQTPEAQFRNLSGAQQGPAPFYQGQARSSVSSSAGAGTAGAALSGWDTRLGAQLNTPNQWMMGLSALLRGASAAGNAGWKPFGS